MNKFVAEYKQLLAVSENDDGSDIHLERYFKIVLGIGKIDDMFEQDFVLGMISLEGQYQHLQNAMIAAPMTKCMFMNLLNKMSKHFLTLRKYVQEDYSLDDKLITPRMTMFSFHDTIDKDNYQDLFIKYDKSDVMDNISNRWKRMHELQLIYG